MKYLITAFTFLLLTAMSCKKNKDNQSDQLPPATQIGANTIGCKINGHVFIPKGYSGTPKPNPHKIFDGGLSGLPYLQIDMSQFDNNYNGEGNVLVIFSNLNGRGNYDFPNKFNFSIGWKKYISTCGMTAFDTTIKQWGGGYITKYDLTNGIISGTFNFKYKTLTCDTVYVTDGRFDFKL